MDGMQKLDRNDECIPPEDGEENEEGLSPMGNEE